MGETICSGEMAKSQRAALRSFIFVFVLVFCCFIFRYLHAQVSRVHESTTRNGLIEIACIEYSDSRTPTVDCCAFFWCAIKIENGPKIDGLKVDAETVRQCQNTNSQLSNYFVGHTECARAAHNKRTNPNGTTNEHGHFQLFQNKPAKMGATNPSCGPLIARHSFHLILKKKFSLLLESRRLHLVIYLHAKLSVSRYTYLLIFVVVHYESLVYRGAPWPCKL